MSNQEKSNKHTLSRRDALKSLAAATGATALATLPLQWKKPVIEAGLLPAHAQTSMEINYPFSHEVAGIDPADSFLFENRGWLIFNIKNGIPEPIISTPEVFQQSTPVQGLPFNRPFPTVPPSWTATRSITIPYTFLSPSGAIPKDGTVIWLYGRSLDGTFEGAIDGVIIGGEVSFTYPVPDAFTGQFYLSANFLEQEIILTNETFINSTFYFGVGLYGTNAAIPPGGSCSSSQATDVILVVELSSSAFGTELPAKLALKRFVDSLDLSSSQVAVISFANAHVVDQMLTNDANAIKTAIDGLTSTGVTMNPAHGIYGAQLELSSSRHKADNLPVMIILSRGFEGFATTPPPVVAAVEAKKARDAGTRIIAVGMNPSPAWELGMKNRWTSSTSDYYSAGSAANLVTLYDHIVAGVGCPVPTTGGGGGGGGGGTGTGPTPFGRTVTTTLSILITPDVQAGQVIKISATGTPIEWRVSLLDPDGTAMSSIAGGGTKTEIMETAPKSGTYVIKLTSTSTNPVGQAVTINGTYEVL